MSNGFRVGPPAVRAFAREISGCEEDTTHGIRYLKRHGDLAWYETGQPFLNALKGPHETVMAELTSRFTHLEDVLERSAVELEDTATYYEETDEEQARQFDQTQEPVDRPTRPR